jgi:activator of HSP90 ATPase
LKGDVIRSFNRDTAWLATGVLGALVLAALMLAVQEYHSNVTQDERDFLLRANPAAVASVIAESSSCKGKTDTPLHEISSGQTEPAVSTPISAPASTPQKSRDAPRQDSAQASAPKTRNVKNRSSLASRFIDVKKRLIELWHQSLARSETRSWTAFSKLNNAVSRKTAAYTTITRD